MPLVRNWKSEGKNATHERERFFDALASALVVPGALVEELEHLRDRHWRNIVYAVRYPSQLAGQLPPAVRPFVQLEVGSARVTPGSIRPMTSWVHDYLKSEVPDIAFEDNRPRSIHCVLPEVTCLEKIEAISRRFNRAPFEPATFVRHYEDIARILRSGHVPERSLLEQMKEEGDLNKWPEALDPAFVPEADPDRWELLKASWQEIQPLFWGERISLGECAGLIRELVDGYREEPAER